MGKRIKETKTVILRNNLQEISNIYELEKIGAGHDGRVFRLGNKALKLLKYDIEQRKNEGLMTFKKAIYFKDELDLKRITMPTDIILDTDGVYTGYVMDYLEDITSEKRKKTPTYKQPGDFTCGELIKTTCDLEEDFNQMTKKHVIAKDINRGSYIYSYDFMHLCDMDKYEYNLDYHTANDKNKKALNFTIAKYLYYEILKLENFDKQQLKELSNWVKKCSNSRTFLKELEKEIGSDYPVPVKEYVKHKVRKIL